MSEKLALVTGASSGIGLSLAKELYSRGYDLVICSAGEKLEEAARGIGPVGDRVIAISVDLSTRDGVDDFWNRVAELDRPVDVACINAGVGVGGLFWETDVDAELNMVELNCAGTDSKSLSGERTWALGAARRRPHGNR